MKVYLACTVRGSRAGLHAARAIASELLARGHEVLTAHLLLDDVEQSESALTERNVFERDLDWLDACDLLIAEASGSSYGVGFEVGYVTGRAERTGQRVYLFYDASRKGAVSRLVSGNCHPACTTVAYGSLEELRRQLGACLEGAEAGLAATADPVERRD